MISKLPKDKLPLHDVSLSNRTENILKRENITDFSELQNLTFQDLLKFKGFGRKCLAEVRQKLEFYGLSLKKETSILGSYRSSASIMNSLPRMLEDLHYYIFNLQDELKTFEFQINHIESFLKNTKKDEEFQKEKDERHTSE